jgi:phospholipase C
MPDSPKSEPLVGRIDAGSNARIVVVGELHGDLHTGPPVPSSPDALNRSATIKRIRHDWIEGVLNQSLYREARLELGLEARDDVVASPLGAVLQVPDRAPIAIDPGSPMTEVFDRLGQAILILGAPGTGKTTILLELAKGLLERAEADAGHPIPAVFNLSTWALKRMPLRKWLASELNTRTGVPKKLAHRWVEDGKVLPLLDGLDEMDSAHRVACVDAINEFRGEDGLLAIAVCSRAADYEAIGAKLHLLHAVVVRPLSSSQVEDYLSKGGDSFSALRQAVTASPSFSELLQTPLMLWVAVLANRNSPIQVAKGESLEEQTKRLFQSFVEAMFRRGAPNAPYGKDKTLRSLSWLASALDRKKQTVFYVENLGFDWFGERNERWWAKAGIIVVCALVMAPIVWLGLSGGLLGEGHGWTWWLLELFLVFAVVFGLVGGPISTFVQLPSAEKFRFRLVGMRQRIPMAAKSGAIGGAVLGVVVGLFSGVFFGSMGGTRSGLLGGLMFGVSFGSIFGFLYGLFTLFTTEAVDERRKANQGTLNSVRNVLAVLFVAGLSLGLAFGLVLEYAVELDDGLIGGVLVGAFFGLVGGLIGGGLYAIRNVVLRLVFWMSGSLPLGYVAFLDYAASKLFLRKVGGGYIFVHRMLLEYLADSEPAKAVSPLGVVKPSRRLYKLEALGTIGCLLVAAIWYFNAPTGGSPGPTVVSSNSMGVQVLQAAIKKTRSGNNETSQAAENSLAQPGMTPLDRTKHIIVVMLEGSSFDRTLGALKSINPNVDGLTGSEANPDEDGSEVGVRPLATSPGRLKPNPMSTFAATDAQIFGGAAPGPGRTPNMRGFVKSFLAKRQSSEHARNVMYYFDPEHVPVLATLALEFAVCDHWFSSMPGPSAPNHTFTDYGTSFGRVDNKLLLTNQPRSSIYERLLHNGRSAKIYQYSPRTFFFPLFILSKKEPALSGTFEQFLADVRSDKLPDYSFVEPDYTDHSDDEGNSASDNQGPTRLSATEAFVAQVYDSIHENRSVWESSILVIVYASHDGFYDHVIPPATVPDGFVASGDDTGTGAAFAFDRLGVRVPAIIISPYIPRGTVDHTLYDHSSIPASVAKLFLPSHGDWPSRREKDANTFLELLQLGKPRSQKDTVALDRPN